MLIIGPREVAAAVGVLARGDLARYSARGTSQTERFENELASAFGVGHGLAVNSGTSALICALVGAGIGPGDEVLVPAYTWVSTAAAPLAVGAVPVLVEIDDSLTIDPEDLRRKITPATRAVIPVHMLNLVCDMDAITKIADEYGLVVIEDACQAIGVRYRGRRTGTIGDAGVFSFNQHKNMRCGEGGAVVTQSARIDTRARMYHDVGSYERAGRVENDEPVFVGVNARMPELSAAVLRPQLRRLDAQLDLRKRRRARFVEQLRSGSRTGWQVVPHHDPEEAVGIAIAFDDPADAIRFGQIKGARRLFDTGRHVYTNWQPVVGKQFHHPDLDPHRWIDRSVGYDATTCPQTLEILARTCTVELAPEIPTPAFRVLARRFGR